MREEKVVDLSSGLTITPLILDGTAVSPSATQRGGAGDYPKGDDGGANTS